MAVYKVPQDVEADDKLIGPFSFRQFIYLIIVALSGVAAWGLAQLFIPLLIIPLPIILFFGALALPLRKDQPMEIYLAAMISYFLKPHKRLWDADGIESLIQITVPKTLEVQRTKDITRSEAEQRFGYLADLVDSKGWAVRGAGVQAPNSAMNSDVYFAAQQAEDILDNSTSVAQNLDYRLEQSDTKHRQEVADRIRQQIATPVPPSPAPAIHIPPQTTVIPEIQQPQNTALSMPVSVPVPAPLQNTTATSVTPIYNPYPTFQQAVLQPLSAHDQNVPSIPPPTTSEKPVLPDIINLASNTDLSIETISREANRIHEKEDLSEEVIISLR